MYFDVKNRNIIIVRFIINVIGINENTKFLLFLVSSDTNLLMATGKLSPEMAIRSVNVGIIIMYSPVPSVPRILAKTILINMLIIFVIKLPIVSNITDFMNLFFIFNNMIFALFYFLS